MSPTDIILIVAVGLLAGGLIWLMVRSGRVRPDPYNQQLLTALESLKAELASTQTQSFLNLRDSIDAANKVIHDRLAEGSGAIDRRLAVFAEVEKKLADLSAQTRNLQTIGENIQSLSELLRPPKLRGQIGEQLLENLLNQILPTAMWEKQYQFPNGPRVDAVIRLGERLLPIDAKFPLEAFQRLTAAPDDTRAAKEFTTAIKKHVDAIASKYIRPNDSTTEFALMYIPAEAVYYRVAAGEDSTAFEYALANRVIPSSPGHLYSFLASLSAVYSEIHLAQASLAEGGRELSTALNELSGSMEKLTGLHQRMEGSLRALSNALEKSRSELSGMQQAVDRIHEPDTPSVSADDQES